MKNRTNISMIIIHCLWKVSYCKEHPDMPDLYQVLREITYRHLKLYGIGVNEEYACILDDIYTEWCNISYPFGQCVSKIVMISSGVIRQGDTLSPKVFTAPMETIFKITFGWGRNYRWWRIINKPPICRRRCPYFLNSEGHGNLTTWTKKARRWDWEWKKK